MFQITHHLQYLYQQEYSTFSFNTFRIRLHWMNDRCFLTKWPFEICKFMRSGLTKSVAWNSWVQLVSISLESKYQVSCCVLKIHHCFGTNNQLFTCALLSELVKIRFLDLSQVQACFSTKKCYLALVCVVGKCFPLMKIPNNHLSQAAADANVLKFILTQTQILFQKVAVRLENPRCRAI